MTDWRPFSSSCPLPIMHHSSQSPRNYPQHLPHPQVTSPHLLYPPHYHRYNQNPDPCLDSPDWSGSEPPCGLSYLLRTTRYTHQNQDLQNQNQFRDEPYTPGPVQDTWRPTLPQLQCPPLGSTTGGVPQGGWSSMDFNSSSADDFTAATTQFYHDSYHDNCAPQPFCSPSTPGPSPHYPQTPNISSPGPQMPPRTERLDETLSCCLHEYDRYLMTSDPGQHQHPHQTTRHLLQNHREPIQDQTGLLDTAGSSESWFSPQGRGQDVSGAAQSTGLDAGLNWSEERGGGRGGRGGRGRGGRGGRGRGGRGRGGGGGGKRREGGDDVQQVKRFQPETGPEVLKPRLLCTMCPRDFRSLPALNGHMRSHSGSRSATWLKVQSEDPSPPVQPSVSMVMPVSVPVQSRGKASRQKSRLSPASVGATPLYRSLLHQEEDADDGAHYTPPPMLRPVRAGPGLYCSLATRRQLSVQTVQLHNGLGDLVAMETASPPPGTLINKPRINEGRGFQAGIPPMQSRNYADSDSHNALLLWTPRDELERPVNQQRVEALMMMARSSVVPGGGASPESALHVLSECRGDFLLTVEKLLSTPENNNNNHNHTAQQYPSVSWSSAERRLLIESLQLHHKDFSRIQKVVQTKSVSQCVEFYYLWKRKLSLRTPAGLTVTLPDTNGQRSSRCHDAS